MEKRIAPAKEVLPIGTTVKVNCYMGRIVDVCTGIESIDPVTKEKIMVPLRNPVYHVRLSTRKSYSRVEHARYIWLRKGRTLLRLFADEFEVVAKPAFMDTREVIRRYGTTPTQLPGYVARMAS